MFMTFFQERAAVMLMLFGLTVVIVPFFVVEELPYRLMRQHYTVSYKPLVSIWTQLK